MRAANLTGYSVVRSITPVWGTGNRRFKSGYPDHLKDNTMKPDVHNYTSDKVFDGVRILTEKQREEHLERLKRALEKRNNGK